MIDVKLLRDDTEKVKNGVAAKHFDISLVDKALELDGKRLGLIKEIDNLRAKRNEIAKAGKASEEGKKIKEELKAKEPELDKVEDEFNEVFAQIPNLPLADVPEGAGEGNNVELRRWGEPRKFDFEPKDHLELGKSLGILDFETGAKVVGSQFYYLYGGYGKINSVGYDFKGEPTEKNDINLVLKEYLEFANKKRKKNA